MKRVLIDTNIYLNFYRMSRQSLELLDTLIELVDKKEIEVILPKQIEDEFWRCKNSVIEEVKSSIAEITYKFIDDIPAFLNFYRGIKELNSMREKLENKKRKILEEYDKRVTNPMSLINRKIEKILKKAIKCNETKEIVEKAYFRTLRGNPPKGRKLFGRGNPPDPSERSTSFGDSIIWETILEKYTDQDLIIISQDSDFIKNGEINDFLKREWEIKSKKEIKPFTSLSKFVKKFAKDKKISEEIIEEEESIEEYNDNVHIGPYFVNSSPQPIGKPLYVARSDEHEHECEYCNRKFIPGPMSFDDRLCDNCSNNFKYSTLVEERCITCGKTFFVNLLSPLGSTIKECPKCRKKSNGFLTTIDQ